jgi:hypothetical protein
VVSEDLLFPLIQGVFVELSGVKLALFTVVDALSRRQKHVIEDLLFCSSNELTSPLSSIKFETYLPFSVHVFNLNATLVIEDKLVL